MFAPRIVIRLVWVVVFGNSALSSIVNIRRFSSVRDWTVKCVDVIDDGGWSRMGLYRRHHAKKPLRLYISALYGNLVIFINDWMIGYR